MNAFLLTTSRGHLLKVILFFLVVQSSFVQAQDFLTDSPIIRNYSTEILPSAVNYSGVTLPDNTLFFANAKGVLRYDGSQWDLIPIKDSIEVISLLYKDGIIYVGGNNEFGYLEPVSNNKYNYVSFTSYYGRKIKLNNFFQIVEVKNDVYFQTYGHIFRWDGTALHNIPIYDAYIFNLNNSLYASVFGQGIALIENDKVKFINTSFKFKNDAAYNIFETANPNEFILYTSENGTYKFNTNDYSVTEVHNEASDLFKKDGYYFGTSFLDSLWVASTWDGGIVIFNSNGKVLKFIDKSTGILGKFLRELFIDNRNKIWVTSEVGISEVYWPALDTLTHAQVVFNKIRINNKDASIARFTDSTLAKNSTVSFEFLIPGFKKDEVEYSFLLQGRHNHWSVWESDNTLEFYSLDGGDYLFGLKARTVTGIETDTIFIGFKVKMAWYKTITAYIVFSIALLALLALVIWLRTLRLKISNKRLESVVNERTKQLLENSKALEIANSELKVKNQELDQFVYRSSHDLIAPLKSLKGLIYLAGSENLSPVLSEYIAYMGKSVNKLEEFIKSVIDYTTNIKTEGLLVDIKPENFTDDIFQELRYFDRTEKVELIKNIELPVITSDPKRLKIILSNLISNSLKYHNYKQENPFIEVKFYKKNGKAIIEVKDNGQGIRTELIDKIFDMFFRANDKSDGSGLGLYIVKDTVDKINGKLKVDSTYGKGTVFTITLDS